MAFYDPGLLCARAITRAGNWIVNACVKFLFSSTATTPSSILVYRHCFIGDFVVIVPALRELKRRFPGASITLLTTSSAHPRWKSHPANASRFEIATDCLDNVIEFRVGSLWADFRSIRAALRKLQCSACVVFPFSSESISSRLKKVFLLAAFGIRKNVIVGPAHGTLLLARNSQADAGVFVHQVDAAMETAALLVSRHAPRHIPERNSPIQPMRKLGNVIVVAPGTKHKNKEWPLENFTRLIHELLDLYPSFRFELIGGKAECELGTRITNELASPKVENLIGQLSLAESTAKIRAARMFIGADSGPMHIASLYDVPTVAIFSSVVPLQFWRPWGRDSVAVSRRTPCAYCFSSDGSCPEATFKCVKDITVEEVLRAAARELDTVTKTYASEEIDGRQTIPGMANE